jgi:hypothetical protein
LRHDGVARLLQRSDLLEHQLQPVEKTGQPRLGVHRQQVTIRSAQRLQLLASVTAQGAITADPERRQHAVDLVGDRQPFPDQILPLAQGSAAVLLGLARDRHHRAHPRLAAQPGQGRAQQHLHIQRVRLRPPRPAIDGHARGLDHVDLDPTREQPPRQPEPITPGLVGHDHPADPLAGPPGALPQMVQVLEQGGR